MERPALTYPPYMGTADGKDANFSYEKDGDSGTLTFYWESFKGDIWDREVIGIIGDPKKEIENGVQQSQFILRVLTRRPNSPEDPKDYFRFQTFHVTGLPLEYLRAHYLGTVPEHLKVSPEADGSPNLHVIISVRSGVGEAQRFFDDVLIEALSTIGLRQEAYNVHTTTSENTITEITEQILLPRANKGIPQTILLLSGDGGIVDIVNTLLISKRSEEYKKPTIGLISMGTGNALANSTFLQQDLTRGLRTISRGRPHPLPTFTAHFSPGSVLLTNEGQSTVPLPPSPTGQGGIMHGVVVCSWALHASLVADSDTTAYRKFGSQRFQMAAKELMASADGSRPHVYDGKITLFKIGDKDQEYSEEISETKTSYIVATLVSNFEKSLCISPYSRPLDGQLRVLRFGDIPAEDVMRLIGMAMQGGGHEKDAMALYEPVNALRIQMDEEDGRWRRVCVDGKIVQVEEGGWIEVRKGKEEVVDLVA
ncbi:MAG: hypothetical protein L6R41_005916 [Letrouitia leprolyta]|nr:MAG: hypothetical protein L6R41_005916 [Letrouitia leprolyta]